MLMINEIFLGNWFILSLIIYLPGDIGDIATHQEESCTQWQDASRSAGCSSETWKYRWLDIQSRRIHHHRHHHRNHHHHHHNCNALSPAQKWMTLTGTQQRPRPRYSTTARPLMKCYIILSFYIIVQPHTLWRSFCSCERWWCAWWRSSSLFTIYKTCSTYFQKDEEWWRDDEE